VKRNKKTIIIQLVNNKKKICFSINKKHNFNKTNNNGKNTINVFVKRQIIKDKEGVKIIYKKNFFSF